jgi:hypothetical protein
MTASAPAIGGDDRHPRAAFTGADSGQPRAATEEDGWQLRAPPPERTAGIRARRLWKLIVRISRLNTRVPGGSGVGEQSSRLS